MTTRSKWILLVVAGMPLLYFLFPFTCGFLALPQEYVIFLVPIFFFGPLVAGSIVVKFMYNATIATRALIGVATCLVLFAGFFVSFFLFPPGAATWTLGFAANFRLTKHPAKVQQWATEVLDRYETGKLVINTNVEHQALGQEKLNEAEVPEFVRKLWWLKPSIGIATMTSDGLLKPSVHLVQLQTQTNALNWSNIGLAQPPQTHCVAFSWYLTGILVGRTDFRPTWNPWYIHEIMPGIYAYSGMK